MKNIILLMLCGIIFNFPAVQMICQNVDGGYKMCKFLGRLLSVRKVSVDMKESFFLKITDRDIVFISARAFENLEITDLILELAPRELDIDSNSFIGLTKLERLEFASGIVPLRKDLFKYISHLTSLALTVNGTSQTDKNELPTLLHLKSLKIFKSNLNKIDVNSFFNIYTTITHLKLLRNNITWIERGTFAPLKNLKHLYLRLDEGMKLHRGVFDVGLDKLETLVVELSEMIWIGEGIFNKLKQLLELQFTGNKIESIGNETFCGMNIKNLTLNDNKLTNLWPGMFGGLKRLRNLDLSSNEINHIEIGTFSSLNLSKLNLENNKFKNVKTGGFHGLITDVLRLSQNEIVSIENGGFSGCKIKKLLLSKNKLEKLKTRMFEEIQELTVLNLNSNQIAEIEPGVFLGHNLTNLTLTNNELTHIKMGTFNGLVSRELYLSKNGINHIENGAFNKSEISSLQLFDNQIEDVKAGMFHGIGALKILNLSENKISRIANGSFTDLDLSILNLEMNKLRHITAGAFQGLMVRRLRLSHNQIVEIEVDAFRDSHIRSLHLNNNKLSQLKSGIFNGINNLEILKLSNNDIDIIDAGLFTGMNLLTLDLTQNKLLYLQNEILGGLICHELFVSLNSMDEYPYINDVVLKISNISDSTFLDSQFVSIHEI